MLFWIITGVLAFVVATLLAWTLLKGRTGQEPPAAYDLRVYRDQLKEVEKDLARGVINAEDAERTKAEISRRILAADAQVQSGGNSGGQPDGLGRALAVIVGAVLVAGSIGLYWTLGVPGYGDLSLKQRIEMAKEAHDTRPGQDEVESQMPPGNPFGKPSEEYLALVEKLRTAVAANPDDLQGNILLARNEAALGNFRAGYEAQRKVLDLKGETADAQDFVDYADMMILAAGGYVSPEAETALLAAMSKDPRNGSARYYLGLMLAQTGRPDRAFQTWNRLMDEGPADAPWIEPIRAQIEEIAMRAGVRYELPEAAPARGPSAEDMQAASELSAEDRQEMIRNMVSQLAERLATEGGTPEEWARLISAYGVMGETERAQAVWQEAQQVFKDRPEALETVRAGAQSAGLQ
ncbi:c-type cytochrome biogenesis protein CcmI [Thalassovita sp.]|uniref:c-type cytochrome biogenesis protein CcmI n=1 Tax=Thalassovita sp. TaxID=1979401 RepID=UPI0029DE6D69|nr:c-type cytochrome biogenesis protein CcmI [Thalassovita sp.]